MQEQKMSFFVFLGALLLSGASGAKTHELTSVELSGSQVRLEIPPCPNTECVLRARVGTGKGVELHRFRPRESEYSVERIESEWLVNAGEAESFTVSVEVERGLMDVPALVVHVVAGFDHLFDRWFLLRTHAGEIKQVWQEAGAMTRDVAFTVVRFEDVTGDGTKEIIRGAVLPRHTASDNAETWTYSVLRWRGGEFRPLSFGDDIPVHVVVTGSFKSPDRAFATRDATECLSRFSVLESSAFPKLAPGLYVVALPTFSARDRDAALKMARSCITDAYVKRGF